MDITAVALAASLTCHAPINENLVGLWESTNTSRGGIGHNFEFRKDGTYTSAVTVLVDLTYVIKNGVFYTSNNKDKAINYEKGTKIEITKSGFTLIRDDGNKEIRTKIIPSNELTIVGTYKYRHSSGGIAYEKYTSDGLVKFRLPMESSSGCYAIDGNTITIKRHNKEPSKMIYNASENMLKLKDSKGTYSYNLVPEGAWYQGNEINYQKPSQ
jgi:hypothetical protein